MRRRLYFVGQGGSPWRDPRNWAHEEGGSPLRHLHARGNDHVIVCGVDGHEYLDLRGMPHGVLEIRGYTGRLRLPNGARLSLVTTRWARLKRRIRRELVPVVPPSFVAAVDTAGGWRRAVLDRLASLGITPRGAVIVMPAISGGSGFVQATCNGSNNGSSSTQAATVVNAPSAGNMLVLSFAGGRTATPDFTSLSSVTDSKGNTWVIDKQASGITNSTAAMATTMQDVGVLTTSDTITVHASVGSIDTPSYIFAVHEISGIAGGTRADVNASNSNTANSTARSAGTTSATANAVEVVWAVFAPNATETSFAPAAGYSSPATAFYTANGISVEFAYKVTSATGTQSPTGTGGVSTRHRGVCVAYKTVTPVTQTASIPYEATKGLVATAADPYETLKGLAATASEPYEAITGIAKSLADPYETLTGLAKSAALPYSSLIGIRTTGGLPYEALLALRQTASLPYESLGGIRVTSVDPYETMQAIMQTAADAYESLAGVHTTAINPYEVLAAIRVTVIDPYETLVGLVATGALPYSALSGLAASLGLPYETLAALVAAGAPLPFETLGRAGVAAGSPYETLGGLHAFAILPYSTLERLAATSTFPYETLNLIAKAVGLSYESLTRVAELVVLPYETLVNTQSVSALVVIPYEALEGVAAQAEMSVEALLGVISTASLPYEARFHGAGFVIGQVVANYGISEVIGDAFGEIDSHQGADGKIADGPAGAPPNA